MKRAIQITCIGACLGLLTYHAGGQSRPTSAATTRPETQPSKKDDNVSVSFKDMSIEQIASFLGEKLKKPVLISEEVKKKNLSFLET